MDILVLLFILYMVFSVVATSYYLWHCAFSKDDLFVLSMSRIEQKEFLFGFIVSFVLVSINWIYLLL